MLTCSSRTQAVQTGWIFSAFRLGAGCWSEQPRSSKWESLLGQQTWTTWKLTSVSVCFHLSRRNPAVMNYSLLNFVIFFPPVAFLWVGIIFEECLVWWCGRILYSLSIAMTPLLIHTVLFHRVWFIRITHVPLCLNSGTLKALFCFVFWWIFTGLKKEKKRKGHTLALPGTRETFSGCHCVSIMWSTVRRAPHAAASWPLVASAATVASAQTNEGGRVRYSFIYGPWNLNFVSFTDVMKYAFDFLSPQLFRNGPHGNQPWAGLGLQVMVGGSLL